jgi:8-oxo-dGTP pyrophosphatase MutT (NUDIX family)
VIPTGLGPALTGLSRQKLQLAGFAESAVLVPIVVTDDNASLLFTVRRSDLRTHAGQISFPGGKRDASDADLIATALRETEEELGIPRERVEVLGLLDDVPTPSSYVITPVVGLVRGPIQIVPQANEVAETFSCGWDELSAPGVYQTDGERTWLNVRYVMHEYRIDGRRVWGATAHMVHQLLSLTSVG